MLGTEVDREGCRWYNGACGLNMGAGLCTGECGGIGCGDGTDECSSGHIDKLMWH